MEAWPSKAKFSPRRKLVLFILILTKQRELSFRSQEFITHKFIACVNYRCTYVPQKLTRIVEPELQNSNRMENS